MTHIWVLFCIKLVTLFQLTGTIIDNRFEELLQMQQDIPS